MLPWGIVMLLFKTIKPSQLCVVFGENHITSFSLVQILHAPLVFMCVGIVWTQPYKQSSFNGRQRPDQEGAWSFDCRSAEGVLAVKWSDNKRWARAMGLRPIQLSVEHGVQHKDWHSIPITDPCLQWLLTCAWCMPGWFPWHNVTYQIKFEPSQQASI